MRSLVVVALIPVLIAYSVYDADLEFVGDMILSKYIQMGDEGTIDVRTKEGLKEVQELRITREQKFSNMMRYRTLKFGQMPSILHHPLDR